MKFFDYIFYRLAKNYDNTLENEKPFGSVLLLSLGQSLNILFLWNLAAYIMFRGEKASLLALFICNIILII